MTFKTKSSKDLKCKECGETVHKVDVTAVSVLCWKCTAKSLRGNRCADEEPESEK